MTVVDPLIRRLGARGAFTLTFKDGTFTVNLKAPGPYLGRCCTTDEGDYWSHCHLGAASWQGEGPDLFALLTECDDATRPRARDVDELRWAIKNRQDSRTYGPPLPSYMRWGWGGTLQPWRPGQERWLHTFDHKYEYLDGYLRDLRDEKALIAERAESSARAERRRVQRILTGGAS